MHGAVSRLHAVETTDIETSTVGSGAFVLPLMTLTKWPAVYISSIAIDRQEVELVPGTTEFIYIQTLVSNSSNNCGNPGARNFAKCYAAYHLNSDLSGGEVSMPSEVPSSGDTRYPQLIAFDLESVYY